MHQTNVQLIYQGLLVFDVLNPPRIRLVGISVERLPEADESRTIILGGKILLKPWQHCMLHFYYVKNAPWQRFGNI